MSIKLTSNDYPLVPSAQIKVTYSETVLIDLDGLERYGPLPDEGHGLIVASNAGEALLHLEATYPDDPQGWFKDMSRGGEALSWSLDIEDVGRV